MKPSMKSEIGVWPAMAEPTFAAYTFPSTVKGYEIHRYVPHRTKKGRWVWRRHSKFTTPNQRELNCYINAFHTVYGPIINGIHFPGIGSLHNRPVQFLNGDTTGVASSGPNFTDNSLIIVIESESKLL
ncbi:MAG: hypothetical protein K8T26_01585 [Lentisphaerae bacterium]|nr:hypothetical protein [Lentisphaerota bacterium]